MDRGNSFLDVTARFVPQDPCRRSPGKDCASSASRRVASSIEGIHHGVWYDMKSTIQYRPLGTLSFSTDERTAWISAKDSLCRCLKIHKA